MANLKDLFVSKVRVKLIQTFLKDPSEMFYVRQLVRITNEEINAVRRELARMEERGLVKKEPRGNRLYYFFVKSYDFYQELISLTAKTVGLGASIIKSKNKLGNVKFAMLSGRYARKMPRKSEEDIDLLLIGAINLPELSKLVRKAESNREKEINYAPMTMDEFQFRKSRRDPFLQNILSSGRVMLIGDEEEMVS
ncbi:MAG: winged helix-turn-helix domain-containing protein [Patescibacteria group bacterium]|nr:winged helix-turn-helix domain-containing protein [Patescibacteria group bacterium]